MIFFPSLFHPCPSRIILCKIALMFYWSFICVVNWLLLEIREKQILCICPVLSLFYDIIWKLVCTGRRGFCPPHICTYLDSTHIFISHAKTYMCKQCKFAWIICPCCTRSPFVTLLSGCAQSGRRTSYQETGVVHRITFSFNYFLFAYVSFILFLI
jgi:hypothetical protein